jgi:hypothetical protein
MAVLAFFATVWVALGVMLIAAPHLRLGRVAGPAARVLRRDLVAHRARRDRHCSPLAVGVLAASRGVPRRRASHRRIRARGRWEVPLDGPQWYVALQGAIGIAQLAIGIAMVRSYRRAGIWGRAIGP